MQTVHHYRALGISQRAGSTLSNQLGKTEQQAKGRGSAPEFLASISAVMLNSELPWAMALHTYRRDGGPKRVRR